MTQAIAVLFTALFVIGLGSAVFAGEAKTAEFNPQLREEARKTALSTPTLVAAESKATKLQAKAVVVLAVVHRKRTDLSAAEHRLSQARARLADAKRDERHFTQRLVAMEARELRELEREERQAQKQAESEQRNFEETEEESRELASCDPNYEGECLTPGIGDYDCAGGSGNGPNYVYSPVTVVGEDIYGLDANNNGIGCEAE